MSRFESGSPARLVSGRSGRHDHRQELASFQCLPTPIYAQATDYNGRGQVQEELEVIRRMLYIDGANPHERLLRDRGDETAARQAVADIDQTDVYATQLAHEPRTRVERNGSDE